MSAQIAFKLMQAMAHRLKAIGWPDARDVADRQADARRFAIDAANRFTPSMALHLDIARIPPTQMDGKPPSALPAECPWSLPELLAEDNLS